MVFVYERESDFSECVCECMWETVREDEGRA